MKNALRNPSNIQQQRQSGNQIKVKKETIEISWLNILMRKKKVNFVKNKQNKCTFAKEPSNISIKNVIKVIIFSTQKTSSPSTSVDNILISSPNSAYIVIMVIIVRV